MGEHVHVSETTARDPFLDGCDAYQQAKAALEILEVGLRLDAVVRTVTYVTDMADTELVARAHREAFGTVRPAATLVGCRH